MDATRVVTAPALAGSSQPACPDCGGWGMEWRWREGHHTLFVCATCRGRGIATLGPRLVAAEPQEG